MLKIIDILAATDSGGWHQVWLKRELRNAYQKIIHKNENKYFCISLRKNTVLFRTRIIFKMSARPKRSVSRLNHCKLADVKVPRRTRCTKVNGASFSESSTLYQLKILEHHDDNNHVKVRYAGNLMNRERLMIL